MPKEKRIEELIPCPFCGGKAEIQCEKVINLFFYIECQNCYASSSRHLTEQEAITAWNTRTVERGKGNTL